MPIRRVGLQPGFPAESGDEAPDGGNRHQGQGVLAGQAEGAHCRTKAQPQRRAPGPVHQAADHPDRQADEEDVEDRLLEERVEEDGGRVQGQRETGHHADAAREQPFPGGGQQDDGGRANQRLAQANHEQIASEHGVEAAQEIGVERGLVEDVGADPVTCGEALRP